MTSGYKYILPLHEVSRANSYRTGMKAANLGELLQAGFNVPNGFVLSVEAFERFRFIHGFSNWLPQSEVLSAPLPDDVLQELMYACEEFGDLRVAVRSSGVAEDLPGASYAGQYETVLGALGRSAISDAVSRCWSSAFSHRLAAYRPSFRDMEVAPLAVLIQRLVEPDAAGVAFTVNPVTGDRNEILVSAVRGLGDRLVSGVVQPDEWTVEGGTAECQSAPEKAVRKEEVLRIAALANQVRTHFDAEQDIEWALVDDDLFLLQARPVTAIASDANGHSPVSLEIPPGFWQREITHFPHPTSVMIGDILDEQNAEFQRMCAKYGLLLEGVEIRLIDGWAYARVVPLGGREQPSPPPWLMWLLVRTVPSLRRRVRSCRNAIRLDRHGQDIERWYNEWRPDLAMRLHALAAVNVSDLSDEELAHHIDQLRNLVSKCLHVHFQLHGAMMMVLAEFLFVCRDLLGWDDRRALTLLSGLSSMSTEPSRALADLAAKASASTSIRGLLERDQEVTTDDLCSVDVDFGKAFDEFVRYYGCRTIGIEFVEPTLAEQPELLLRLIRDQIATGYDPDADAAEASGEREQELEAAQEQLRRRRRDFARFQLALARAERTYPVREDSEFFTVSAPLGLGRLAALEVGRRLVDRHQMSAAEDIFFLTMAEQHVSLLSSTFLHDEVRRRSIERSRVEANPGPPSYGTDPGPPPDVGVLPKEARFAMAALQAIMLERILAPDASARVQEVGYELTGIAAAQGSHTGTARVVTNESDFDKVESGDILVCPITSPVWSVLFPSIGALVTDTGGILSHAAIIAREYRLPAIVGTGNATRVLSDGDVITVDGSSGTIRVHSFAKNSVSTPAQKVEKSQARLVVETR
jgi:rifampicin phosphotransferase